jgi:hypothetical protein
MAILSDAGEIQPDASRVTVKVYDPAESPEMVVLVPLPWVVVPPGVLVNVQVPVAGKPFKTTLPVDITHVGCVILPGTGAAGNAFTVKLPELVPVPEGVVTLIGPVVAPAGRVAVICVALFTVNKADCPL